MSPNPLNDSSTHLVAQSLKQAQAYLLHFKATDCYCLDDLLEVDLVPNVWCNFSCSGNPHQICGGNGSILSFFDVGKRPFIIDITQI